MEIYDFRNDVNIINEELDSFTNKQRKQLAEAIDTIKKFSDEEQISYWSEWFNVVLLPILKSFAELTASELEINRDKKVIQAAFKNENGFDISESCLCMKIALLSSVYIGIGLDDDCATLVLIYDCNKFVSEISKNHTYFK